MGASRATAVTGVAIAAVSADRMKHAATRASSATAFRVLVSACTRAPTCTPCQSSTVNAATSAAARYALRPANAGTSAAADSASTIDTAATLPQVEIQSFHPTTNPAYSPIPVR